MLVKIHILNEEEDYYQILDITCDILKQDEIRQIIRSINSDRNQRFNSYAYIDKIREAGFWAKELEFDFEI